MNYACGTCGRFLKHVKHESTEQMQKELGYPPIFYSLDCKKCGVQQYPEEVKQPIRKSKRTCV